jgi:hypothetical protein
VDLFDLDNFIENSRNLVLDLFSTRIILCVGFKILLNFSKDGVSVTHLHFFPIGGSTIVQDISIASKIYSKYIFVSCTQLLAVSHGVLFFKIYPLPHMGEP